MLSAPPVYIRRTFWDDENILCAANIVATNHTWLLSTCHVAGVTEELNACLI